jgi:peptide/nickel transport system substrate-binding protein
MFRRIGWQVLLVGIGFLITAAMLVYLAATYTTEFRPAPGGTYVESVGGYPQSLNPLLSFYNDADSDVVALVFSGLSRMTMDGSVEPDLAQGWEIDPSGITYTFHLNTKARWHDDMYVTSDDVLFTVDLIQDPDYPGPQDLSKLWNAVHVQKIDDYTVQFVLEEPYAAFMDYTTVGLLPAHLLKGIQASDLPNLDFNREPIGTGPFRLTEVTREEGQITSVMLKRYPRYYGASPYLENIVLRFYPTPRAAFEAYKDGLVEGIARVPVEILAEAWQEEDLVFHTAPTSEMVMLYLNELITDTLPFNDRTVRQAMLYGLDRQRLVDEVLMGQAIIPETPLLPGTWAYSTQGVPAYVYDPQQAQTLLTSAGWRRDTVTATLRNTSGDTLQFTLIAANDSRDMAMAEAIASQWRRLGISVTVDGVPPLALSGALESRSYQALLSHLVIPGDPDFYPLWHETQAFAGQNYAGFRHRRISEVLEQARTTVDRSQRIALYREFQQLFMEEVPALPLYVPVYTYAIDRRVQGTQIAPLMHTGDRFRTVADWFVLQRRVVGGIQEP